MRRRGTGFWMASAVAVGAAIPCIAFLAAEPEDAVRLSAAALLVAAVVMGTLAYRG